MAYMSYCMFEGTTNELRNCVAEIKEAAEDGIYLSEFLKGKNVDEREYVHHLFKKCKEYVKAYKTLEENDDERL